MSRRPFTLFEVEKVAEYPDPGGTNFCEPIQTEEDQAHADDEAIRQFWTVYGYRQHHSDDGLETILDDGGSLAIFDTGSHTTGDEQFAIDLAFALADGKPVFIRGTEVTA